MKYSFQFDTVAVSDYLIIFGEINLLFYCCAAGTVIDVCVWVVIVIVMIEKP